MTSSLFPVAPTAEAALHAPAARALRESEAAAMAGGAVVLTTEIVGPAFATRDAAADAYGPRLAEPGCALRAVTPEGGAPAPAHALVGGPRRWPERAGASALWRLQVTYWRSSGDRETSAPQPPARRVRRDAAGLDLDAGRCGAS